MDNILRMAHIKACTKLSRSSIYLRMANGTFPKPIPLGPRAVGWLESEINAWFAAQAEKRDAPKSSLPSNGNPVPPVSTGAEATGPESFEYCRS